MLFIYLSNIPDMLPILNSYQLFEINPDYDTDTFVVSNLPYSCPSYREDPINVDSCACKDVRKIERKIVISDGYDNEVDDDDGVSKMNCT